jgi:ubiquitin-protein ligase
MIEFNCIHCGKRFKVPDELAGRNAKCKACGGAITVPPANPGAPKVQPKPILNPEPRTLNPASRLPMRTRRLMADAQHITEAFAHSPIIRVIGTEGSPPEKYRIEYRINSLAPTDDPEVPEARDHHEVEIQLTADYPRVAPMCKMLTPIYHPNIDPSHICVGDHWAAGERLVDLVIRIGEMIAYQAYNIRSPLDAHAAMYADLNVDKLPTDARTIRPAELG